MRRFYSSPHHLALTAWESKIFRFLLSVARAHPSPPQLRVAGGWVRDKLLGIPTGDVDIAVRGLSGFAFASRVHADAQTRADEVGVPEVSSVAAIAANPSRSRHLETAAVRLDGRDLDFVQLRTEHYVSEAANRVPSEVRGGTPEEDARRRDFTVNALFYNLETCEVEDLTRRGLSDLGKGVLRTPVDARVTLLEDPLRALRAVRFACRLGFRLHEELAEALGGKGVRESLMRKVSRERVGGEVMQIVEAPQVVRGLGMLAQYGLTEAVFGGDGGYLSGVEQVQRCVEMAERQGVLIGVDSAEGLSAYGRKVLILAALLEKRGKVDTTLKEALRASKRLQEDVCDVIEHSVQLEYLAREWYVVVRKDRAREEALWVKLAETVREAGLGLWQPAVILASVRSGRDRLLKDLAKSGISSAMCTISPAVDGRRLQLELGLSPGPAIGEALRELLQVQMRELKRDTSDNTNLKTREDPEMSAEAYVQILKARRKARWIM